MLRFPDSFPALETPRLVLDALSEPDAPALFEFFRDPETMRYWSSPPWTRLEEVNAMLSRMRAGYAEHRDVRWAIRARGDARPLGTATLFHLDPQNLRAEVGYLLGREHWGRGYMREALTAMLDWGFGPLGLHRVEADIDPRNERSVHALEKLGFTREGLLRERWRVGDEVTDSLLMGLLRREWTAQPRPPVAPAS